MSKVTEELNRKFNIKKILCIVIICIVLIVGFIVFVNVLGRPYDMTKNTYKEIVINENDDVSDIAAKLKNSHIIKDESTFKTLSALSLKSGKYKSGTYLLSPSMNFNSISSTLVNGINTGAGFTIPAGYTVDQTINALAQEGIIDRNDYDAIRNTINFSESFSFVPNTGDLNNDLEGYLYPDKYSFSANNETNAVMVITTMLDGFDNMFNDEYKARAEELGLSINEIITIASVIEKTTSIDKEKPEISSVIHNRINIGMRFKNGFPSKPICSPGIESIKAALYPADNENLYFVKSYKLDGSHFFVDSLGEYIAKNQKYKQAKLIEESDN